ncbi:MAG: TadE/TadG family type IV pilus assembly protein [Pseudomonadota bacterium]
MRWTRHILATLWNDVRGSSTIEFALLFPLFLSVPLMTIESGIFMTRYVLLDRGVDIAIRDLRLNTGSPPTFDELKTSICQKTFLITNCDETIQIELQPVEQTSWSALNSTPKCTDVESELDPYDTVSYTTGGNNELMLVRVCAIYRPFLPSTRFGMSLQQLPGGNYAIIVETAFVNEPSA